jgi:hypothetical protein
MAGLALLNAGLGTAIGGAVKAPFEAAKQRREATELGNRQLAQQQGMLDEARQKKIDEEAALAREKDRLRQKGAMAASGAQSRRGTIVTGGALGAAPAPAPGMGGKTALGT